YAQRWVSRLAADAHGRRHPCTRTLVRHLLMSASANPIVPDPLWYDDLRQSAAKDVRWLWTGYLAGGVVTLLTSRWKAGKTTLLSVLMAKMAAGGELAGSAVAAGRAGVVSEGSPEMWRRRGERLGVGPELAGLCRP